LAQVRAIVTGGLGSIAAALLLVSASGAAAHEPSPTLDPSAALRTSQAAVGREIGERRLRDTSGRPVDLARYRGKPLIVNLVYTACTDTCPIIVQTLARAVETARAALGRDSFAVVTIGFDSRTDTPERMRAFARAQGIDGPNWEFLSADHATVDALTEELGFIYFASPKGFDHLAQVSVIDASGRVHAQVYGDTFAAPALVEPLKSLALGSARLDSVSGVIERVRLFCTLFDPTTGRYRVDYTPFIAFAFGVLSLGAIALGLARAWMRELRTPRSP
jgi:protein SCO1